MAISYLTKMSSFKTHLGAVRIFELKMKSISKLYSGQRMTPLANDAAEWLANYKIVSMLHRIEQLVSNQRKSALPPHSKTDTQQSPEIIFTANKCILEPSVLFLTDQKNYSSSARDLMLNKQRISRYLNKFVWLYSRGRSRCYLLQSRLGITVGTISRFISSVCSRIHELLSESSIYTLPWIDELNPHNKLSILNNSWSSLFHSPPPRSSSF